MTDTNNTPLLGQILSNAVAATKKGAEIVREIMASGDLGIVEKTGIDDLQTKADRSVSDCIMASLRARFPDLSIVSEEGDQPHGEVPAEWVITAHDEEAAKFPVPEKYAAAKIGDFTVWIDPLDGTKEYTQGFLDHVTVLVGIAVGQTAVAGVINQPFYNYQNKGEPMGRTLFGIIGSGVKGIERSDPPADQRIVTTTRSHGTGLVNDCAEACKPTEIIRVGGAGHKVMLLIEGKAHAYVFPSPGTKKWDTCAPEAILHALGGKLTDIHGNFYQYGPGCQKVNEWGTLATITADIHKEYCDLIPQEYKDQVKDYYKNKKK